LAAWKEKRKVMGRYNVTAESYDEQYGEEQKRKYCKALQNVEVEGKALLDVGCGSGLFFREVAAKAGLVVGVDVSFELLLKANLRAKRFGNVFVVQADADYLPFKVGFFGAVFFFTVLQNMPKPTQTLAELKRVAKHDGRVAVTGLKKAFTLDKIMDLLEGSGMAVVAFVDDDTVNCYVSVLSA